MSAAGRAVKCVLWDLDGTLWEGVLAEGGGLRLRPGAAEVMRALDERGILQTVVSRNDPALALARVADHGLAEYLLYPQVSWGPKSAAVTTLADVLGLGPDTFLFVDDSPFERAEVSDTHPLVRVTDSRDLLSLLDRADLSPAVVTADGRVRRARYQAESRRREHEAAFAGPRPEFLRSLAMTLELAPATAADLDRAEELTLRTNQLNTTGLTFSRDELLAFTRAADRRLLVASLDDVFGSYGQIGLVLLDLCPGEWRIRLFLMSCRVMGRNVGGAILAWLAQQARARDVTLTADFRPTQVNRPMYIVYRMAGFRPASSAGDVERLRLVSAPQPPAYLRLVTRDL